MSAEENKQKRPDLTKGIALGDIPDSGMIEGHVGDEAVLVARHGNEVFAIGATCSHYNGPLAEGLLVGDTVRCPWHHACFSLRTGEAVAPPAINPVPCWKVEQQGGKVFVRDKAGTPAPRKAKTSGDAPERIVIVGGGGAGFAAAEMLRREGFAGSITMLSSDEVAPYDRPNCSKDFLAGTAQADWMPMRPPEYYKEQSIDLQLKTTVSAIDPKARKVTLADGKDIPFDRLLLATGAEPIKLKVPGADRPHVHVLRSMADAEAIIAAAKTARRAVVIGASFIGLEVAASLRARKIDVHVVAPERRPLERILGAELGDYVRKTHEKHGVVFDLEDEVTTIEDKNVTLKSGKTLDADLVVVGIGVKPRLELAEKAGLKVDKGVLVNEHLQTSAPGIYAAGDIARWPDRHSGETMRVEHWVVAERQGQVAARNMMGQDVRYEAVPFFWSLHYDDSVNYVGHADKWDQVVIEGDVAGGNCVVHYQRNGSVVAVASVARDVESLKLELAMERGAL
jgi:NADPH-dependent 2,4-dienoyl-CoA reductase/sulfur reductase-like enzyme/nitrite reductase/ring-hydroxylating ferredoxin subunit